jgi:hypothetical protein
MYEGTPPLRLGDKQCFPSDSEAEAQLVHLNQFRHGLKTSSVWRAFTRALSKGKSSFSCCKVHFTIAEVNHNEK